MTPITEERAEQMIAAKVDGVFSVGEIVEIKGSRFRVQSLGNKRMVLKILPRKTGE